MNQVSWDELRIAWQVASSGSLSKAGKVLGMNHATVLRRVNALEESLNVRLFLRHQRGYQLTDAGRLLISEMPDINQRMSRLENLLVSTENRLSGPLLITTVIDYMPRINVALKAFRDIYPEVQLQIIATDDILPLSSGMAHISLRMGSQPGELDVVARSLMDIQVGYFASSEYISQHGLPSASEEFNQHFWVMPSGGKQQIPFIKAIIEQLEPQQLAYQSNNFLDLQSAIVEGMGIGPMPVDAAEKHLNLRQLECVEDCEADPVWFAYHRDMKTNRKVQALYTFMAQHLSSE
ncbi:LysR family transcriptional regulator [Parendozoicomonas sp. Alg238-R29]|uniref:LysR family transcriptional regulator n=1 Tax=Parendozoicomonas sp. Alg238-R29 TaxID=2993446 RepID=UPI00248DB119|nr:LysR family transcriptional regulator [Parendozoicomonas sp. Alg238-R29]